MNANQVIEKILSQAQSTAQQIKAQADEKLKALKTTCEQELAEYYQQTQQLAQAAAREQKNRVLAAAKIKINKELTEAKRQLLESVVKAAYEKLKNLNDDEYLSIMENLILRLVITGNEEVVAGKEERRINEDFISRINQKLASSGKGNLRLATDRADFEAGFMLRQARKRTRASLDELVKNASQQLEGKLAELLFG